LAGRLKKAENKNKTAWLLKAGGSLVEKVSG
jgi:hypothetical protein